MADAERKQEAIEPDRPPRVDGPEQLVDRHRVEPLARDQRAAVRVQAEDVARRRDQPLGDEQLDPFGPQPLDVEGAAADEVAQPLDPLRRTDQPAGAPPRDLARLARRVAAARRADDRKDERRAALGVAGDGSEDLRDDVAGALKLDRVADADVLARDLVLVVERRVGHDDPADADRLEPRDRGQLPRPPDLDVDRQQLRRRPLGGKFVGQRPARPSITCFS